ncbi:MAG: hypothetical protein H0U74_16550 [Bradymonadaceae bacterium]|nr:hypothetical protein [Lujinxingiaceae bacterium]
MKRLLTTSVFLFAHLLLPTGVFAQSPETIERFEELVRQGQEHFSQGQYEQALEAFDEAETIFAHPLLSFRITESNVAMGRCAAAQERLSMLRQRELAPGVEQRVDALEEAVNACVSTAEAKTEPVVIEQPDTSSVQVESHAPFPYRPVAVAATLVGVGLTGAGFWLDYGAIERQHELEAAAGAGNFNRIGELEQEAQTRRFQATMLYATGALAISAGIVTYLFAGPPRPQSNTDNLAITGSLGRIDLIVRW